MQEELDLLQKRVKIDGGNVEGIVTAVTFRPVPTFAHHRLADDGRIRPTYPLVTIDLRYYVVCEVSWVHNGVSYVAWFERWRLVEKKDA